jgi:hypothetical protein
MTNSSEKGEAYEDDVFRLVQELISDKTLPYPKDNCVFSRRKSFRSHDRDGEIAFENVVALFAAGVDQERGQPSLVLIFECKSYESLVDVAEIEEFKGKLDQLRGFRSKGYVVTRKGFQRAALNYARSHGIGLVRFVPESQRHILMHFMTPDVMEQVRQGLPARADQGLTNPSYISHYETEFGMDGNRIFPDISKMVIRHILSGIVPMPVENGEAGAAG